MRVVTVRWSLVVVALWGGLLASSSRGEDLKQTTSLRFVPASAAFYTSSLRLGEQYNLFVNSRAFERLQTLPFVQLGVAAFNQQYSSPDFAEVRKFLKKKENKELVALLSDAASHEIFAYGDVGLVELALLTQDLSNQARLSGVQAKLGNPEAEEELQQETIRSVLQKLIDNRDKLKLSPFVIGVKVSDGERALRQIGRLEPQLAPLAAALEENVKITVARTQIGKGDFLTLTVDLGSIDWSEVEQEFPEGLEAQCQTLLDHMKGKKITVALGLQDGYLLFSVAEGISHLQTLGEGQSLGSVPDFERALRHQDERVTSLWYASKEIAAIQQQSAASQARMVTAFLRTAMESSDTPDETKKAFEKDLRTLEEKIGAEMAVAPHSLIGCSFLTPRGSETFQYLVGDFDGTRGTVLPILKHLGSKEPILFAVTRAAMSVAEYDELRPVIAKLYEYGNTAVLANIDEENKTQYEEVRDLLLPFTKRLDGILRDSLIPALADGQQAIILDAQTKSTQWFRDMPESSQPLPILEAALVLGLSNADQFKEGMHGLWTLAEDIIKTVQKKYAADEPEVEFPPINERGLTSKAAGAGELFTIDLPEELGVDSQIAGILAVSDAYAVFGISLPQATRVLEEHPFQFDGPLAKAPEKILNAQHFHFAGLIDAIVPWVGYAFEIVAAQSGDEGAAGFGLDVIHGQVDSVLDVLKCYRGTSSVTYEEKGAVITHSESRFTDLPE